MCGVLLIIGFLTSFGAAGVVGVMVVAFVTNHRPNGFFIFRPGEGYEYVLNLAVAATAVAGLGPGRWSADGQFDIDLAGLKGLAIVLVFGIGGATRCSPWRGRPTALERIPTESESSAATTDDG